MILLNFEDVTTFESCLSDPRRLPNGEGVLRIASSPRSSSSVCAGVSETNTGRRFHPKAQVTVTTN
jgi:hypothetical protein